MITVTLGSLLAGLTALLAVFVAALLVARSASRAATALRTSEQRYRSLVQHSSDIIVVIGGDARITYQSPSVTRVLGYGESELIGARYLDLIHPDDLAEILQFVEEIAAVPGATGFSECRFRHRDGHWLTVESNCHNLLHDSDVRGFVLNTRDISDRKDLEAQLEHRAFHDALTGLANRALFRDRVEHLVARSQRRKESFAVLFLDLDGFKLVNDTAGHAAGDELLALVGEEIRRAVRDADTAARLGGDEFAILLEDLSDQSDPARVAERLLAALRRPFTVQDREIRVDASIGIAVVDGDDTLTADDLLRNADIAMYLAKNAGKGRYEIFEPSMHLAVVNRLELEADLQHAIERDEFTLHYQPIVVLDDRRIVGVEALIRWQHPERGIVGPGEFIPLAEETGQIVPISRWVFEEAATQARRWQDAYPTEPPISVSVNVSARHVATGKLVADVAAALDRSGLAPRYLTLEITESALVTDTDTTIDVFRELKALGVRLAIDDFGTGYSSLAYLQRFPVDMLKIDRSFIDGMTRGTQSPALVRAIVELGRSLELETVAEGIEHAEQVTQFRDLRCHLGQGFLFARPAEPGSIDELLANLPTALPAEVSGQRR